MQVSSRTGRKAQRFLLLSPRPRPPQSGTFFSFFFHTKSEPLLTHLSHPKSTLHIRVHSGCRVRCGFRRTHTDTVDDHRAMRPEHPPGSACSSSSPRPIPGSHRASCGCSFAFSRMSQNWNHTCTLSRPASFTEGHTFKDPPCLARARRVTF